MIRMWIAALVVHSALSVGITLAALIQTHSGTLSWLPDNVTLGRYAGVFYVTGSILAFVIAAKGPRPRRSGQHLPSPQTDRRMGRRISQVAVLLLLIPVALVAGTLSDSILPVAATVALGSAAIMMLLSPWMALYVRWFGTS